MFIIVRHSDNVIIGNATRQVDEVQMSKNGYKVFEIEDYEFSISMLGMKLESFTEVK